MSTKAHVITIQLIMEVPPVETKVGRDTQVTSIKNYIDSVLPSLGRTIRGLPVQMLIQRESNAVEEFNYEKPKEPIRCRMEDWECVDCGGRAAAETVGMFSGRRWVHTCGESVNDRARKEQANV